MQKDDIQKTLTFLREHSPKRNFKQGVDCVVILRNVDLKRPEEQVDVYATLPFARGKEIKICGIVGAELRDQAKSNCDFMILSDDFLRYEGNKKAIKKLANKYQYFIAQAALMPQIAKVFGRVLGPKQKMPNPKAGCVVPPNANLKPLVEKLKKTVRVMAKTTPVIQISVGNESQPDAELVENAFAVYNAAAHAVKDEKYNIKETLLKFTMSPAYKVGGELVVKQATEKTKPVAHEPKATAPASEAKPKKSPKKKTE
ncbi:50S ribosomal protein L1 [Candidatus Woesearchaeota archaeon]|nr:50S ribosomal protein L1 [Candidatus Woesearchaeota archaeon]